ncbi:MAG: helix-hairpin-helix domain-containing protein [Patescibacteria group bacterium]|nr:helix-hairpin-helix domain-containing protein [Patescibacteria group bacterium]MCL5093791.1 helix-hairpin-helix domain-containing protein [Patescibacteria group bacterium]
MRVVFLNLKKFFEEHILDFFALFLVIFFLAGGAYVIKKSKEVKPEIKMDNTVETATASETAAEKSKEELVNINTAAKEELDKLPGVGEVIAQAIIDFREENGGFQTKEDLKNVQGIGDSKFSDLEPLITVE